MLISVEDARRIAEEYVINRLDLPQNGRITRGFERDNRWIFKLRWKPPNVGSEFDIMYFTVDDAGTIVADDVRAHVQNLLSTPEGFKREDRLLRVITEDKALKPWWLRTIKRSKPFIDRKGIDGFVKVSLDEASDVPFSMPFQAKSSVEGLKRYFQYYPHLRGIVTGIVIQDSEPDDALVSDFVAKLSVIRNKICSGEMSVEDFKSVLTNHVSSAAV